MFLVLFFRPSVLAIRNPLSAIRQQMKWLVALSLALVYMTPLRTVLCDGSRPEPPESTPASGIIDRRFRRDDAPLPLLDRRLLDSSEQQDDFSPMPVLLTLTYCKSRSVTLAPTPWTHRVNDHVHVLHRLTFLLLLFCFTHVSRTPHTRAVLLFLPLDKQ